MRGWSLALALACACSGADPDPVASSDMDAATSSTASTSTRLDVAASTTDATPTAAAPEPMADCAALERAVELAKDPGPDAFALALLCPTVPLSPSAQRAALMQVTDPAAIETLLPRLDPGSETAALARLSLGHAPETLPERLDDPASAIVIPVDDDVLAQVALAHAIYISKSAHPDDRTRAQAYLARVHLLALDGLGLAPGTAAPPFARALAGLAVHHARTFCTLYWQRRVDGLAVVFADVEARLFDAVLDLDAWPHRADSALVATERERGRAYLLRNEDRMLATRAKRDPSAPARATSAALLSLPLRVDRLLDQGFVDLAITIALARGTEPDGYGLAPAAALVHEGIARRSLHEYSDKLATRLEQARARQPAPPESGPTPIEPRPALHWPTADENAARAHAWLAVAPPAGFSRRHAQLRAIMLVREDPAAGRLLASRALDDPSLRPHAGLLLAQVQALDADTLSEARVLAQIDAAWAAPSRDAAEARTRRRLALAAREAGTASR